MKVLITGCSKETYWYEGKIGEIFEVEPEKNWYNNFTTVGGHGAILPEHCHVIQSIATVLMEREKSGGELEVWGENSKAWIKIEDGHKFAFGLNSILRIKPVETPQYRHYTFEEAKEVFTKDGWVESKISGGIGLVTLISKDGICVAQESLTYESLLEKSTHLDGTPCGVKIN